jgi:hypothetical protein
MTRGSSRIQNAVLLVLCGVVAALGFVNWRVMELEPMPPLAEAGGARAESPAAPVSSPQPVDHDPLSAFDEMVRRPVFTASRSPFAPTQSTPDLAGPPDIRLTGVAIDASKKRALLRSPQQPQGRWVEQGQSIDGWELQSVRDDAVVITSGQQIHELRLYPVQNRSSREQ